MFLGHYAVAFAARRAARSTSLGALFLASVFIDLLWPLLLRGDAERARIDPTIRGLGALVFEHDPVSHSLLMVGMWAILLGGASFLATRDRAAALVIALLAAAGWWVDRPALRRPALA
jgi:hypothetical protein